jgi:8-oxo-dGTP diphosphatase
MPQRPGVGVAVIVKKDNKVLYGKRIGAHDVGRWASPGGHLEYGESWEECARREIREEYGIEIKNVKLGMVTNDIFKEDEKHYITICMVADYESGETKIMEPDSCAEFGWFDWNALPQPLMVSEANRVKAGFDPFKIV